MYPQFAYWYVWIINIKNTYIEMPQRVNVLHMLEDFTQRNFFADLF